MDTYVTPEWIATNERKQDVLIAEMHRRNPDGRLSKLGEWLHRNDTHKNVVNINQ